MPWVYMVRCSDSSLYIGHTDNICARERTHNEGRGSRYTSERRPVKIVYSESYDLLDAAIAQERQLKRWTTAKKEALIAGDFATLKSRSVRRRK